MTLIFAHRGAAGTFPENTMEAFIAADKYGADGIELDVQLSKDGEMVVIHDETVNRTTNGKGFVKDFNIKDLQKLNASYQSKSLKTFLKAPYIPSLREVFEWMKTNNLLCNIELKTGKMEYPLIEEKVIQLIREFGYEKRIIISSFNHYSIVHCYRLAPEIEIAPLYSDGLFMPWVYATSIHAKGIHPNYKIAPDDIITSAMENGIQVRPYTVNKEKDIKRLLKLSCSAIITDYPKEAIQLRNTYTK